MYSQKFSRMRQAGLEQNKGVKSYVTPVIEGSLKILHHAMGRQEVISRDSGFGCFNNTGKKQKKKTVTGMDFFFLAGTSLRNHRNRKAFS